MFGQGKNGYNLDYIRREPHVSGEHSSIALPGHEPDGVVKG